VGFCLSDRTLESPRQWRDANEIRCSLMNRQSRVCWECGGHCTEYLLVCADQSCKAAFHSYCQRPPRLSHAEHEWYCSACRAGNEVGLGAAKSGLSQTNRRMNAGKNGVRRRAKRVALDPDPHAAPRASNSDDAICHSCGLSEASDSFPMLLCDAPGCDLGWHTQCLQPPLDKVPEGEWLCPHHDNPFVRRPKTPRLQSTATAAAPARRVVQPVTYRQQLASALAMSERDTPRADRAASSQDDEAESSQDDEAEAASTASVSPHGARSAPAVRHAARHKPNVAPPHP
jgi:hypothetical protein